MVLNRTLTIFTGLLVAFSAETSATTIVGGTVNELSQQAKWIGRLQIESIQTIPSSSRFPSTQITAQVLEVFKGLGDVGQSLSFQIPGGRRGNSNFVVMGFPTFKVGSEYVLFLDSDPQPSARTINLNAVSGGLVGWSAFRVLEAPDSGSKVVIRAGEPSLLQPAGNGRLAIVHDRSIRNYDDFVSEIYRSLD